jgi:crossover junction endodeoxyribonuclease RuvC
VRILGVDPGSRVLGYAVLDVDRDRTPELALVECGVLVIDGRRPLEARLGEIVRELGEIVREHRPDVAAVEDVFVPARHVRSALALGQARGAVLAALGLAGLRVHAYSPSSVKQAVTGRGGAPKAQVALMVRALVGLRRTPRADAADALAVAVAHAHIQPARAAREAL